MCTFTVSRSSSFAGKAMFRQHCTLENTILRLWGSTCCGSRPSTNIPNLGLFPRWGFQEQNKDPKEKALGKDIPLTSGGKLGGSPVKTRTLVIPWTLKSNKYLGADIHDPKAVTSQDRGQASLSRCLKRCNLKHLVIPERCPEICQSFPPLGCQLAWQWHWDA